MPELFDSLRDRSIVIGLQRLRLDPDNEFLYYAELLASLRREEIVLIAALHRNRTFSEEGKINQRLTWSKASDELVPQLFHTEGEMRAIAQGATRTGLLVHISPESGETISGGASGFISSPLMDYVQRLAPFDDALREEGIP